MCNRYASDIRKAGKERDYWGFDEWSETRINPMLGNAVLEVFPKSFGPVLKLGESGELEWAKMRWGLPGPPQFGSAPVTNIRNTKSPHWRPLLGTQHRCLVPFTAFSEYEDASPKGKKVKGELYSGDARVDFSGTAGWRAKLGPVIRFAPTDAVSDRLNLLDTIRPGAQEVRDVQNLVELIADPYGDGRFQEFWDRAAKQILAGLIIHVVYAEPLPSKTLARVWALSHNFGQLPDRHELCGD